MERLQKVIAASGYTSRRKAEELILNGQVSVNGKIIKTLGTKVDSADQIMIDKELINRNPKKEYYLLNKPRNTISSLSDTMQRKTVVDYIDTKTRIYPIGRLDYDTTGIIILTNDGELANHLMHPKYKIEKTYIAKLEGILTKEDIIKLEKGIKIDDRKVEVKRFKVKRKNIEKNTSIVEITIIEGRNHIVKRLFESLGIHLMKLSRTGYAFLNINDLKSGEYRPLTIKEVKKLYSLK